MFSAIGDIVNAMWQLIGGIISIMVTVLMLVSVWKLYTLKGYPGWYMFIPIYNLYILCVIAHVTPWVILLFIIPGVNVIAACYLCYKVVESYGRGILFTIGVIFLPFIFIPLLAFSY